jgi:uncharacterized protein
VSDSSASRTLFRDRSERRLRAGWRLVLFHLLLLLLTVAGGLTATLLVGTLPWGSARLAGLQAGVSLAWVAAVVIAGRFLDRRPFADFGFHVDRGWWLDLAFGLVLGAVLMAAIFLVELAAGWIAVVGTMTTSGFGAGDPFPVAIVSVVIVMIGIGIGEEIWTRGYLIRNLAEGFSPDGGHARPAVLAALVLSSVAFAVLHLGNPSVSPLAAFNLVLVSVLLLGGTYVLTGELAIPIGFHVTWNFFQGPVFGFPVSGVEGLTATVLEIEQAGPELWTGGAFGPEGGLVGTVAILAGSGLAAAWIRSRHGRLAIREELARYRRVSRGTDGIKA